MSDRQWHLSEQFQGERSTSRDDNVDGAPIYRRPNKAAVGDVP